MSTLAGKPRFFSDLLEAHVPFGVLYAIGMMLVSSFHAEDVNAVERTKGQPIR